MPLPFKSKDSGEVNTWAYLGEDLSVFNALKTKFAGSEALHVLSVTDKIKDVDIVFFDSADCGFKEILDGITNPLLQRGRKRIISRDRSFYLGSDTSQERGEVVVL